MLLARRRRHHHLPLQGREQPRLGHGRLVAVAEAAVGAFAPRVQLAVARDGEHVLHARRQYDHRVPRASEVEDALRTRHLLLLLLREVDARRAGAAVAEAVDIALVGESARVEPSERQPLDLLRAERLDERGGRERGVVRRQSDVLLVLHGGALDRLQQDGREALLRVGRAGVGEAEAAVAVEAPRPHVAELRERERVERPALDLGEVGAGGDRLDRPRRQRVHRVTLAELAVRAAAPRVDEARELDDGGRVERAARRPHEPLGAEELEVARVERGRRVAVAELAVVSESPGVEVALVGRQRHRVRVARRHQHARQLAQRLDELRAELAARVAAAEAAAAAVPPGVDVAARLRERERVLRAAAHRDAALADERVDELRPRLVAVVAVAQVAVAPRAPREHLARLGERRREVGAASDPRDPLPLELHLLRDAHVVVAVVVAELAEGAVAPREDRALRRHRQRVRRARRHRDDLVAARARPRAERRHRVRHVLVLGRRQVLLGLAVPALLVRDPVEPELELPRRAPHEQLALVGRHRRVAEAGGDRRPLARRVALWRHCGCLQYT